ncbi:MULTISPECIES: monovalent cation/H(+) antiporter subunit G [unclassified Rhizobium]|uniref:monovalent cation/H(+) antiporter subunit G n=1 Tax=unclassified Rhizobium TaxID=2613769 RepID=UPI000EA85B09|nr:MULTISPECIES: monovalent cation/H(+) antiporter subunit G [unclassified Rhizobium]AYG69103.1 cation:proton antiporter [Rhizobium sp. CCGE531]AYG75483.1 cation:proton antiporter [Rhizobium sp. CCGE532]
MSTPFENLPLWAAIPVGGLLLIGAFLTLVGAIGFLKLGTFYERIHAPTLGTSGGIGAIMIASMIFFSISTRSLVIHELLIGVFVTVTTPVTFMLLARAALHRDRAEQNSNVPPKLSPEGTSSEGHSS